MDNGADPVAVTWNLNRTVQRNFALIVVVTTRTNSYDAVVLVLV